MTTISELKRIDENAKPAGADKEWKLAHEFFDDRSRSTTMSINESLGVGIGDNPYPIEVAIFRRVITRLSAVYRAPASRWLLNDAGGRMDDADPAQRALTALFRRARYDVTWRKIDRLRTLFRQVVVRWYPSNGRKCPVARVFAPYNIIRRPSSSEGDILESDHEFALLIGLEPETWEHWQRDPLSGAWAMSIVTAAEGMEESRVESFEESGGVSPYGLLPAALIYDEDPLGQAYLPPRASRTAMQIAINAKSNDLWSLIRGQAHDSIYWSTDDPEELPTETGTGIVAAVPKDAKLIQHSPSPAIKESEAVLRTAIKLWLVSEGIPSADLDDSKTILTGAALRVQERELREKREEQVDLAYTDELVAWEIVRAINDTHAAEWNVRAFGASAGIELELADVEGVTEPKIEQAFWHAEIAAGHASAIDWIRRRDNVPRHEAIKVWARTQVDLANFPTLSTEPPESPGRVGNPGGEREVDPESEPEPKSPPLVFPSLN